MCIQGRPRTTKGNHAIIKRTNSLQWKRGRILLFVLMLPVCAWSASPIARNAPVHISADQFHFDQKTGIGIYTGHVHVTQNALVINGQKLTVIAPPKGPIERLTMQGTPATFSDITPKGKAVKGQASDLLYLPARQQIQLQGKAKLVQNRNAFSSALIVYDTQNGVVTAGAPGKRIEATLVPGQSQNTQGKSSP